jgi:arylsulfatase A-like enzyme
MQPTPEDDGRATTRASFVEAGLLAGLVLALVEQVMLGAVPPGLAWVIATLFAVTGMGIGLLLEAIEAIVRRFGLRGWVAAAARSTSSFALSVPVARTLFEGSFASQLPGASSAHVWVPVLAFAGLTVVIFAAQRWLVGPRRVRIAGLALLVSTVLAQLVNRNVKPSELADLHAGIVVASVAALTLALCALGWPRRPTRARWQTTAAIVGLAAVNLVACVRLGLTNPEHRWTIATGGTDARLLIRTTRALLDRDGDGYAAALGGGDCDDGNPTRNPGMAEIPDNDIDEDCDGVAATADPEVAARKTELRADLEAWLGEESPRHFLARTRGLDIVLVSIDALRADMLADNERNRRDFPHLFSLADDSIYFERAFAPAAGTDLSMSTILSGRIDPFSGIETTLAEAMRAAGHATHAVIPSEVLRYAGKTLLTRGLDDFDRLVNDRFERDVGSYSTSRRTTELALAGIDALPPGPAFVWVHYFDAHEHDQIKATDRRLRELVGDARPKTREERYRAAVKLVDDGVGALLDGLRERGRLDRTVIVLVSDHGESLGEDPRLPANHGLYVYNPLVHVPLLFRVPGLEPRRIATPVSLVDVAPTLAQLGGAKLPAADGTSLIAALLPDAPPELASVARPIVLNESDQHGVIVWPYKLMRRPAENLVELYALDDDFGEREDLADAEPARVRELLAIYHAHPSVDLDRTRKGRRARERAAQAALAPKDGTTN